MTRPLLIDTDPGIDDALALLLALGSPGVSVTAITTVAGNVCVDRATRNVGRILRAAGPARWPRIAAGAPAPLRRALETAEHVHGEDGLGNLLRVTEPDGSPRYPDLPFALEMQDAASLILEAARAHPEALEIVALGPLTNLALALARDATGLRRVRRLVVMGGAVGVPGNVTAGAEFNVYVDPEAAAAVLGAGLPVELIPLDVTRQVVLDEATLSGRLAGCRGARARFLTDLTAHGLAFGAGRGDGGIVLHDPLAVAIALDPSLAVFEALHVEVECEGRLTRGLTLADRRLRPAAERPRPTCRVAMSVDAGRALALVLERLCPACA